jgi:hypothetical protein
MIRQFPASFRKNTVIRKILSCALPDADNWTLTIMLHKANKNYKDGCLLGCSAVWTDFSLSTFQSSVLPPSSGRWWWPDDGGSTDLWNVGKLIAVYMALHPRRQPSSYSPPWEPQITPNKNGDVSQPSYPRNMLFCNEADMNSLS